MEKIIDIHAHLGDCFYPGGCQVIDQKGATYQHYDIIRFSEVCGHTAVKLGKLGYISAMPLIAYASRKRSSTATLENWRRSMDQAGIWRSVSVPCLPFLSFEEIKQTAEKEKRIIPFTSVDFENKDGFDEKLANDIRNGARGLKLHPVLQKTRLNSKEVYNAIEAFAPHELPINFHCGELRVYAKKDQLRKTEHPEYGSVLDAVEMVKSFPKAKFLATHAGIFDFVTFIELFQGFRNVWVDGTIQPTSHIRKLIKIFGPDRVVYASDWPFGNRGTVLKLTKKACDGDQSLERRIVYENAAALLKLED